MLVLLGHLVKTVKMALQVTSVNQVLEDPQESLDKSVIQELLVLPVHQVLRERSVKRAPKENVAYQGQLVLLESKVTRVLKVFKAKLVQ